MAVCNGGKCVAVMTPRPKHTIANHRQIYQKTVVTLVMRDGCDLQKSRNKPC